MILDETNYNLLVLGKFINSLLPFSRAFLGRARGASSYFVFSLWLCSFEFCLSFGFAFCRWGGAERSSLL